MPTIGTPASQWTEPALSGVAQAAARGVLTLNADGVTWQIDTDLAQAADGYFAVDGAGNVYALLNADALPAGYTRLTSIASVTNGVIVY